MSRALVLNASYEPLCVVPGRRALILVLNDKAAVVHDSEDLVHSEKLSFAVPSVIRLSHYVKVPYQAGLSLNRRAVFVRDGGQCQYCDNKAESIDHIIPRSRGGQHTWTNVVAACRSCNSRKRDRLLEETTFKLRSVPTEPRQRIWLMAYAARPEWQPYLGQHTQVASGAIASA